MKEICEIVFRGILQYCVKTLQVELDASVNEMGSDGEQEDVYCTLLYNDETHTFDQVSFFVVLSLNVFSLFEIGLRIREDFRCSILNIILIFFINIV